MKNLKNFRQGSNGETNGGFEEAQRKYGGMSEDALLIELKRQIEMGRQNGSFDKTQMLEYVNKLSPYLTEIQRQKIRALIED